MRSRIGASLGTLAFLLVAPGTVAGIVPWWMTRGTMQPPFFGWTAMRYVGAILIAAGVAAVLDNFRRFALEGRGTPAPVAPTETLVVSGMYRHVRNPMYVGVVAAILGQALLLGHRELLFYAAIVWLGFHLFVTSYEEPTLRARYGTSYEQYCATVPRWIPWR